MVMYMLEMPSSIVPPWSTEFIPEYELCFPLNLLKPCSDLAHQTLVKREGFLSWFEENVRKPMAVLLLIPGSDAFLFSPGRSFLTLFLFKPASGTRNAEKSQGPVLQELTEVSNKFLFLKKIKNIIYSFVLFSSF